MTLYVDAVFDGEYQRHVLLDNNTFKNLAKAPISILRIDFYNINNVSVVLDSDIFTPFTNITRLGVAPEWESSVPSITSDLQMLQIFIKPDDMKLSTASLDFASKWKNSLKQIDLSYSLIDGIYGPVFKPFSNLRILKLNMAIFSLQYISDDAFSGLHKLQELHLAYNQINKLPLQAFKTFENGTLKFLDLSYNALTGIFKDDILFNYISSVTHLNLSGNPLQTIGKWMNALTNLQELKLDLLPTAMYLDVDEWTVPLRSIRTLHINWPTFTNILNGFTQFIMSRHIPKVETLSLLGTFIESLDVINHLHQLNYLDGSGSFAVFKNFEKSWGEEMSLQQLKTLNLASNKIKSVESMKLNTTTPNVVDLDLSNNLIQTFSRETLKYLEQLHRLFLSGNHLVSIGSTDNGLLYLPAIEILDLSLNSITEIPHSFLEGLNGTLTILNAGGNPFACTCAIEPLRKWILSDSQVMLSPDLLYKCKTPPQLSTLSVTQVNLDCGSHLAFYLSIGISSGLTFLLLLILIRKYKWHIKYRLFLLFSRRRKYQPCENGIGLNAIRYDAFISYAHENNHDLTWVVNDLRLNLEENPEPFRLCIGHARDFIPGAPLLESITEAIHNSRKTIIVLSPSYLDSEWCYFETQHAWLRLLNEGKDVIILVLLEPIPDGKMTMWLRQFLCKKGYLIWPPGRAGQKLFFRYLRELLKTPTAVNRRYDV